MGTARGHCFVAVFSPRNLFLMGRAEESNFLVFTCNTQEKNLLCSQLLCDMPAMLEAGLREGQLTPGRQAKYTLFWFCSTYQNIPQIHLTLPAGELADMLLRETWICLGCPGARKRHHVRRFARDYYEAVGFMCTAPKPNYQLYLRICWGVAVERNWSWVLLCSSANAVGYKKAFPTANIHKQGQT